MWTSVALGHRESSCRAEKQLHIQNASPCVCWQSKLLIISSTSPGRSVYAGHLWCKNNRSVFRLPNDDLAGAEVITGLRSGSE